MTPCYRARAGGAALHNGAHADSGANGAGTPTRSTSRDPRFDPGTPGNRPDFENPSGERHGHGTATATTTATATNNTGCEGFTDQESELEAGSTTTKLKAIEVLS